MREGGRRQPGKPPLPEQMLSAISTVALTKEEKCGEYSRDRSIRLFPLLLPGSVRASEQGRVCPQARAAWAGG